MRYRLRTLLILLAILPPLLAVGWRRYSQWRAEQERQRALQAIQWRQIGVDYYRVFTILQTRPPMPGEGGEPAPEQ